jgi:hypothetical protein
MEVGQQYDTIYNSARHNQLLFLLTSVAKTLCENGIMPFLAGQEYSQYARCIFTDGKLYTASRAILANEQPYPTPGDKSGVWTAEVTNDNLVPNSRRVIAGKGLTGGGPLSSDVTLSAKLDGKTTQAAADGAITVKDVAIGGDIEDLASARGQIGNAKPLGSGFDFSTGMIGSLPGQYYSNAIGTTNAPFNGPYVELVMGLPTNKASLLLNAGRQDAAIPRAAIRSHLDTTSNNILSEYNRVITEQQIGDGLTVNNGIISVPEYEGATASTAGTSGLVPPAAAGQQNHLLTGGGAYISKVPNATHADTADNSLALGTRPWSESLHNGNPGWLVGSVDGKLLPVNTGSLNVYYANSAGSAATANTATGLTYAFTKNSSLVLPPGGTWFVLSWWDGDDGTAKGNWSGGQIVAGGSSVDVRNGAFALRVA